MNAAEMELLWRPNTSLGDEGAIFAHALIRHYSFPPGFCFDIYCADEPIVDDINSDVFNADRRSSDFVNYFRDMCKHYKTNDLMHTMGEDFSYRVAL